MSVKMCDYQVKQQDHVSVTLNVATIGKIDDISII